MALPPNIPKRGLNLAEAAEYCGVSETTLTKYGPKPSKIGERTVYDLRVLNRWLDGLASLPVGSETGANPDPAEELSRAIDERKAALRHPTRQSKR